MESRLPLFAGSEVQFQKKLVLLGLIKDSLQL